MKLLKDMINALKKVRSGNSLTDAWLKAEEAESPTRGATLVSPLEQSTWVYSAVTALATNVSQIPFCITRSGRRDGEHVITGPAADLFNRPHPNLDRYQFWELLVSWLQLRGEVFVVALNRDGEVIPVREAHGRNTVAQLLILSPLRFWHIIEGGELIGWRYTGFGYTDPPIESQVFLPEEIMQLRLPNPYDFWRGMSPLATALLAAQTDYASSQYMKGLMINNADCGLIVTTNEQLSPEQQESVKATLNERKRRAGIADRPLFLWGGAKVEKPLASSADLQFLENRKLNRLEIGAVFRVPPTVMGFSEDANRAVAQEERFNFIEQTILPLCARLEAFVEPILKSFGHDLCGWFDADCLPIMQEARRQRGDAASKFFAMGVPLNDINRAFDLGLPQYPWGATGYLPNNFQPIANATQSASKQESKKDEGVFARMISLLETKDITTQPATNASPSSIVREEVSTPVRAKELKRKLSRFFFEQRSRVLAQLQITVPATGLHVAGLDEEHHHGVWKVLARTLAEEIFDIETETRELLNRLRSVIATQVGAHAVEHILLERTEALTEVNYQTFTQLKESLELGLRRGESHALLAERLKTIFQDAADCRAEAIALSETMALAQACRAIPPAPIGAQSHAQPHILDNDSQNKEAANEN
jgi:HK97 family phage portal protein